MIKLSIIIYTKEVTDAFPFYADEHHVALIISEGKNGFSIDTMQLKMWKPRMI